MRRAKTTEVLGERAPASEAQGGLAVRRAQKGEDFTSLSSPEIPADAFRVWLRFLRLDQRLRLMMGRALREVGLSIPQFDVLSALSQRAGITQGELAQKLLVTKGNVSGLIDRLVEAGLVERRRASKDRRVHALFLTRQGEARAASGFAVQKAFLQRSLGRLAARDLALLHRLLGQWRDAVHAAEGGGASAAKARKPSRRVAPVPGAGTV